MSDEKLVTEYLRGEAGGGRPWPLWLDPFTRIAGWQALGWGLLVQAGMVAVAASGGVLYDGAADLHVAPKQGPTWFYAALPILDWLVVALVFLAAGRLFSRSAQRVVDYFGTVALARLPYLVAGVVMLPGLLGGPFLRITESLTSVRPEALGANLLRLPELPALLLGSVLLLALVVWLALLTYRALCASSGLRFPKALWVFLGAATVAEILTKVGVVLLAGAAGLL